MREDNYAAARKLLCQNRDLVLLRYYNSYKRSRTLKVLWWAFSRDPQNGKRTDNRIRINQLHKQLAKLADKHKQSTIGHGGDIYSFRRAA